MSNIASFNLVVGNLFFLSFQVSCDWTENGEKEIRRRHFKEMWVACLSCFRYLLFWSDLLTDSIRSRFKESICLWLNLSSWLIDSLSAMQKTIEMLDCTNIRYFHSPSFCPCFDSSWLEGMEISSLLSDWHQMDQAVIFTKVLQERVCLLFIQGIYASLTCFSFLNISSTYSFLDHASPGERQGDIWIIITWRRITRIKMENFVSGVLL